MIEISLLFLQLKCILLKMILPTLADRTISSKVKSLLVGFNSILYSKQFLGQKYSSVYFRNNSLFGPPLLRHVA